MSKILCVEDDPQLRRLYSRVLSPLTVDTAENGRAGLELVVANPTLYNLIFTDNDMPEIGGLGFLEKIRAVSVENNFTLPPRLLISGTNNPYELHLQAKAVGALGLYEEPFDIFELRKIVEELTVGGTSATLDAYFRNKGF